MNLTSRADARSVALETTLLVHGLPAEAGRACAAELAEIVRERGGSGVTPAVVGVVGGVGTVGMTDAEIDAMIGLGPDSVPKANTANLGALAHARRTAATTVSATCELAARAGVRVFATGGIGGVHRGYGTRLDVSSDLLALARFPVAVVASGVKSLLDVAATREALETLGVPCVGYGVDLLPAFYLRHLGAESGPALDARFDDPDELAAFVDAELARTGRGILICNPVPQDAELDRDAWDRWLAEAQRDAERSGATGRAVTPAVLGALHRRSAGKTLESNLALVRSNTSLAARVARAWA